ncbi:MarR family winged helix-turn-helix transcriptional regulator [Alkalihalobacillus sp. BA299]|uniref:MarR family winged helix-turn-helix transcriptional regulator n=1 Tax=Alkalihalobacillus sp. BA299 TaxID=2815938 RepID=UPI001ADB0E60|nr:MarR family transcriptional regulator [Alkalihalobacillus sp. BA299]
MNIYEQLILSLKSVHEAMVDLMKPSENEGISHGQLFLLFTIHKKGSIKTTQISNYFGITPGAATAIADKLEKLGLIERERDKNDRRIVIIKLSDAGIKYVNNKRSKNLERIEYVLQDFTEAELLSTIESLQKLTETINSSKEFIPEKD